MRLLLIVILSGGFAVVAPAAPIVTVTPTEEIREMEVRRHGDGFALDADSLHSYDQIALSIDYRVENAAVDATGWAYLTIQGRAALASIPFNAENMTILTVTANGVAVGFTVANDTVWVERPLAAGEMLAVGFQVSVHPGGGYGYSIFPDHVFTFAEPYGARRWFPCWDQPYDKFEQVSIGINMPDYWKLAANGRLVETTYPEPGRKREVYYLQYPISTYLVMFAAGNYTRRYETVDSLLYRYIAFPGDSANAVIDWARTPQMVAFYNSRFGHYPFDAYGMVEASSGASMEHQTMTTLDRGSVTGTMTFEAVVAHELAHQWFGDDLSPVDFRNIWLNESFATYSTVMFYENVSGPVAFANIMRNDAQAYFQEDHVRRYAAYDPPADFLFGTVEYQKGSWVLHMLREQLLGDSLFFTAMRQYVAAHRAGTVDTEDFINVVNSVAGTNLHWFFDQWIYQAGHPELSIQVQPAVPTENDVTVTIVQTQTNAPIFRFPLLLNVVTAEGTVQRQFWFNQQTQAVTEHFSAAVQSAALVDFQPLLFKLNPAGVGPFQPGVAQNFTLGAVYPNPFNATARIPFELPVASRVRLTVYDITGQLVATLVDGTLDAGRHEIAYSPGPGMASGIYIISLSAGAERRQVKAVLLR
jgi:aminopeptidase N